MIILKKKKKNSIPFLSSFSLRFYRNFSKEKIKAMNNYKCTAFQNAKYTDKSLEKPDFFSTF